MLRIPFRVWNSIPDVVGLELYRIYHLWSRDGHRLATTTPGRCPRGRRPSRGTGRRREEGCASLRRARSRPFAMPRTGRIAVKVINHLGDEAMKVLRVS